jgi:predicted nuclease with TOPRIM domain
MHELKDRIEKFRKNNDALRERLQRQEEKIEKLSRRAGELKAKLKR